MSFLSSVSLGFHFLWKTIFTSPRILLHVIWYYGIIRLICNQKRTIHINFAGTTLVGPNEHGFFYTATEVYYRKLYNKLTGCTHILDLGGYLGESAVRFSLYNKKVTVIEANPDNFDYVTLNTKHNFYIQAIQGAIVYKKNEKLYHTGGDFSAGGKVTTEVTATPIKNITIDSIRSDDIDGIKIDIEGGEYDIIEFLKTKKGDQLSKGYIEFHYIGDHTSIIIEYINHLVSQTYTIEYENIYGKVITKEGFFNESIAVIYFCK